jgi:hypothetical protein
MWFLRSRTKSTSVRRKIKPISKPQTTLSLQPNLILHFRRTGKNLLFDSISSKAQLLDLPVARNMSNSCYPEANNLEWN